MLSFIKKMLGLPSQLSPYVSHSQNALNLHSLPPDIISKIIQMDKEPVKEARLISHSWNSLVLERMKRTRSSLERVYIRASKTCPYAISSKLDFIEMFAIIPEDYTRRVGIGKWLRICHKLRGGVVEVQRSYDFALHTFAQSAAPFFGLFTHIEVVVLDNFTEEHAFDEVFKSLKNVQIDRLEIREEELSDDLQQRVTRLCHECSVKHVLITICWSRIMFFRNFMLELLHMNVTLDVYENHNLEFGRFFGDTVTKLYKMPDILGKSGVWMRVTTLCDASFKEANYPAQVKAHLRCENVGFTNKWARLLPLKPVPKTRGHAS